MKLNCDYRCSRLKIMFTPNWLSSSPPRGQFVDRQPQSSRVTNWNVIPKELESQRSSRLPHGTRYFRSRDEEFVRTLRVVLRTVSLPSADFRRVVFLRLLPDRSISLSHIFFLNSIIKLSDKIEESLLSDIYRYY